MSNNQTIRQDELYALEDNLLKFIKSTTPISRDKSRLSSILNRVNMIDPVLPESNRENKVFYFFTKPRCNLSKQNIRADRVLAKLNKNSGNNIEHYIRTALDPSLSILSTNDDFKDSIVVQKDEPFITIMSNTIRSFSGHPDPNVDIFSTKPGIMKEELSFIDGTDKLYGRWDATLTFENVVGEPVWLLFDIWLRYSTLVKRNVIKPYIRYLLARQVDYQTGCFAIVTDRDNRTIKHTASTIMFPTAISKGRIFDSNKEAPKRGDATTIDVRFSCIGAEYDDPITAFEFNKYISTYVGELKGYLDGDISNANYSVVPPNLYQRFSDLCLPFIDLYNGKLEWIVHNDKIDYMSNEVNKLINLAQANSIKV